MAVQFQETHMKYVLPTCMLLVAMNAFAERGVAKGPMDLKALDTDGDKMISLPEAQQSAPRLASRFNELDTNHDGLLSMDEIAQGRVLVTRNLEDDFAAADSNADGQLSQAEADAAMPIVSDHFDEMDASADGYVTMEEIHAHAKAHGPVHKRISMEGAPIGAGD
jgi:hypothetical protein